MVKKYYDKNHNLIKEGMLLRHDSEENQTDNSINHIPFIEFITDKFNWRW